MSNNKARKPGSTAQRSGSPKQGPKQGSKQPPPSSGTSGIIWLVVGTAIAVVAAVLLVVMVAGDDETNSANGDDLAGLEQFRPVEVAGTPLPATSSAQDDGGGATAPVAEAQSFDGTAERVPADGTPTMIAFGAHWCPHCQEAFPKIVEWLDGGGAEGVDVVAVATGTSPDRPNYPPSAWLSGIGWPGREVADDEDSSLARAFGLEVYPYVVFVDAEGKVRHRLGGDTSVEQLDAGVAAVTGG